MIDARDKIARSINMAGTPEYVPCDEGGTQQQRDKSSRSFLTAIDEGGKETC
jgi:hypothetical protein